MAVTNPKADRMDVFTIVEKEGTDKSFWLKLGAAFINKDGSLNAYLDAVPVNGKLHIRPAKKEEAADKG